MWRMKYNCKTLGLTLNTMSLNGAVALILIVSLKINGGKKSRYAVSDINIKYNSNKNTYLHLISEEISQVYNFKWNTIDLFLLLF